MEINKQLKLLRIELEITQSELASLVGMQQTSVARYERGATNISCRKAQEIASALGYEFCLRKKKKEE